MVINSYIYSTYNCFDIVRKILFLTTDVPGPPSQPQHEITDDKKLQITWSPPEVNGGSSIVGYVVEMCKDGGDWARINKEKVFCVTNDPFLT